MLHKANQRGQDTQNNGDFALQSGEATLVTKDGRKRHRPKETQDGRTKYRAGSGDQRVLVGGFRESIATLRQKDSYSLSQTSQHLRKINLPLFNLNVIQSTNKAAPQTSGVRSHAD